MKTATEILESRGYERNDATDIVYFQLDQEVRELYNVSEPIYLWGGYVIGDADKSKLLAEAENNTKKYTDIGELFKDMTMELNRLAELYPEL